MTENVLYYGGNLDILRSRIEGESVDHADRGNRASPPIAGRLASLAVPECQRRLGAVG
jgi:hypothetical protein